MPPGSSFDVVRLSGILTKATLFAISAEPEQVFSFRRFRSRTLCFGVMQESNLDDR